MVVGTTEAGTSYPFGPPRLLITRLLASGAVDASFGDNGRVVPPVTAHGERIRTAVLENDGNILAAGTSGPFNNYDWTLIRFSASGTVLASRTIDMGGDYDIVGVAVVHPDGRITIAGPMGTSAGVARFMPDLTLDATFGTQGKQADGPAISDMVLLPDGKIVGRTFATEAVHFVRLDANGRLDPSFGVGGMVRLNSTQFRHGFVHIGGIALQADGRIVAGGSLGGAMGAVRLDPNAPLPLSTSAAVLDFGPQSLLTTSGARRLEISNKTGAPMPLEAPFTIGPGFLLVGNSCGPSLAAGGICHLDIAFRPATPSVAGSLVLQGPYEGIVVSLRGTSDASLATHFYHGILGREPDAAGKAFWNSEAARLGAIGANPNEAWYAMAAAFFASTEYAARARDDAGFVTDLYLTFLDRAPDASGFGFWTLQLAGGMPRAVALAAFTFTGEFQALTQAVFGNTAARAELDMVFDFYRGLLGRLPESAGINHWVNQFRLAQCSGAGAVYAAAIRISSDFADSAEYAGRARSNRDYVGDLYNAFLRRGGELNGVLHWVQQLDSGAMTRAQVRRNFIDSPEFGARVNAVVNAGCAI